MRDAGALRARWPARRAARGLAALLAWTAGCEVLIDGKLHVVHCSDEGAIGPPACPQDHLCKAGTCVDVAALAVQLGAACLDHLSCGPEGICLDPAIFGDDGATCSRPCCTSSDCDPQRRFVCASPPGGGGRFCREAALLGVTSGGPFPAGSTCTHDEDCRSGRCDLAGSVCLDTCCSDTSCAAGLGSCHFGELVIGEAPTFACTSKVTGKAPRYAPCSEDDDCASGLCVAFPGGEGRCSSPCCSSASCETIELDGETRSVTCADVKRGDAIVRACAGVLPDTPALPIGAPCSEDGECRGGRCSSAGSQKLCSDSCCSDTDCGDPATFRCLPGPADASWALRCEHK